jgi:uncharacterized membrane protein HdeD (DUF308 family)
MIEGNQNAKGKSAKAALLVFVHDESTGSWCAKLGIVLVVIGLFAISLMAIPDIDSVPLLSWLIVLGGIAEAVHGFHLRKSGAFFFHLLPAVAGIPLGLLVATHPDAGIVDWMLVFACFFTVTGLFRLISSVRLKFSAWSWAVFDSIVMLVLGCVFWTTSSRLGLRFFDFAVGLSLSLRGLSSIMFGIGVHSRRAPNREHLPASHAAPIHSRPQRESYRAQVN